MSDTHRRTDRYAFFLRTPIHHGNYAVKDLEADEIIRDGMNREAAIDLAAQLNSRDQSARPSRRSRHECTSLSDLRSPSRMYG